MKVQITDLKAEILVTTTKDRGFSQAIPYWVVDFLAFPLQKHDNVIGLTIRGTITYRGTPDPEKITVFIQRLLKED